MAWAALRARLAVALAGVLLATAPAAFLCAPAGASGRTVTAGPAGQAAPALLALQQARLTDGVPSAYERLGGAVALDGDTALVAAAAKSVGGQAYAGAVAVFVRAGGDWVQQAELTCPGAAAGDEFGVSVALDGDTALVGADNRTAAGMSRAGAAYVFVRAGGAWSLQAELTAADAGAYDGFGSSVSLDGDTALVGAGGKTVEGRSYAGAAYVYERAGGVWTQRAELTAADGVSGDEFGHAVALSGDTALVGAENRSAAGAFQAGCLYVFGRSGADWLLQTSFSAPDPTARAGFGSALAFGGDTALVGAGGAGVAGRVNVGAAYVYERSNNAWTLAAELADPGSTAGDWFGSAVALRDGRALVGAWGATVSGRLEAGAAYVYDRGAAGWAQSAVVTGGDGTAGDTFGWAVAVAGDTTLAGAPGRSVAGAALAGAACVHRLVPAPSLTLTAAPPSTRAGRAVALRGVVTNAVAAAGSVTVCRKRGGTLTVLKTLKVGDQGDIAGSVTVGKPGTWVFVAVYKAGGQRFQSPSATVVVKKRPKPPKPHHPSSVTTAR